MRERDERILHHLGLYRISFRQVLSQMFFKGRSPANVLRRLRLDGRITARSGLPERVRYYQLTPAEAERRGLPIARARPPGSQSLHSHLAVLWFCCQDPIHCRQRLEPPEVAHILSAPAPGHGPHCIERAERVCLWRVHAPADRTSSRPFVRSLSRAVDKLRRDPQLGPAIRAEHYAFAILVGSEGRRRRLLETIHRHDLNQRIHLAVECTPTPITVAAALRALR